jgi:hypothetical protein
MPPFWGAILGAIGRDSCRSRINAPGVNLQVSAHIWLSAEVERGVFWALGVGVVVAHVRSAVAFGDTEVGEEVS